MCEVVNFSKLKSVVGAFISAQLPAKEILGYS
jgi:Ca2+-binding EF-hand superfamily protein